MDTNADFKTNYHTHTFRCHHASGSDEEYVLEAIANGYKVLGFSDHACWEYSSKYVSRIRMRVQEFEEYKRSVLYLKEKYKERITILLGLEAEYYPMYKDWMLEFCVEQQIDYLILGNHFYLSDEYGVYFGHMAPRYISRYFETCIEGLRTGMYAYLAHPELIMRNDYIEWCDSIEEGFRRVCIECARLDIPVEYNVLGMQANRQSKKEMYPHHKFWELAAEYGCKAIIGMDAHSPHDLDARLYEEAQAYLDSLGIDIVHTIEPINYEYLMSRELMREN